MATIDVLDATGTTVAIEKPLTPGRAAATSSRPVALSSEDFAALTASIATTARLISAAASTNATTVKSSAGRLYAIQGHNAGAALRYLKLYNKATLPAVGTDIPTKTLALPATTSFKFDWPVGYLFPTGIAFALTTGSADADTGALTAGDVLALNLDYI